MLKIFLTPVRMAIIKNSNNSKYWQVYGKKRTLIHCWWENIVEVPQETKIKLPYDTAIPLLRDTLKE
jgi:hypothetical protein